MSRPVSIAAMALVEFLIEGILALIEKPLKGSLLGSEGENPPDYFRNLQLEDSKLLAWRQTERGVSFLIEACTWPGHPSYEPPRPGEWGRPCFRRASLVFDGVEEVRGLRTMEEVASEAGPDPDYGYFQMTGRAPDVQLIGIFGTVSIHGGVVTLEVPGALPTRTPELQPLEGMALFNFFMRLLLAAAGVGALVWIGYSEWASYLALVRR